MHSLQNLSNKTLLKSPITNQYQKQQKRNIVQATGTTTTIATAAVYKSKPPGHTLRLKLLSC